MTKTISKRVLAMLLCILTLCTLIPATTAFAATQCTIDSTDVTDYFEYSNSSGWHDLNTPQHFVVESGAVAYCIQHKLGNPHSRGYSSFDPTANYSARTIRGIQIILENGYPCSTGGFTAAQARYATANAVRFWLSEEGADGQWNFTNRSAHPNSIRAKSGQQALLDWADSLLAKARSQALIVHSVSFTPSSLNMTVSGDYFVATTRVSLVNCSGGYRLDKSGLPSGTVVDGFTGRNSDTLTIKVPKQYGNQTIRLDAVGYDDRTTANLFWYAPNSGDFQKVITFTTGSYMRSTDAVLRMTTPAYGHIKIVKSDAETGNKLAGAVFGIYSNSSCTAEVARLTIGNNGTATSGDLMMGTYYVREISAPSPYLLDNTVHTVSVGASATVTVNATNGPAKGRITVTKTNADKSLGDYSLAGSVFDIYSGSTVVATVTVDASGKGTSASIPLGSYVVKERKASTGFVLNKKEYPVTLSYAGQTVPIVYGETTIPNMPQLGTITVVKEDAETGNQAQGDATLYGAKYEIKDAGGNVVDTLHALGTRVVTSKPLPLGTYTVTEVESPMGYLVNSTPISVTLSYGGQNVEIVKTSTTVKDSVIKGKISVVKFGSRELDAGSEDDPDIKPPLAGVQFEIRLKSSGELFDTITTDADGKATSKALPFGTYTVTELRGDANEGYKLVDVFDVDITENEKTYSYILEDKVISMMIKLVKVDAVTGKTIPVTGTVFRVEDSAGNDVKFDLLYPQPHTLSEFTTDESGTLYLPGTLPVGEYVLFEVSAPTTYLLNDAPVTFTVSEGSATNQVVTVKLKDTAAKGTISIEKQGEQLAGHTTEETKYGTKYVPVYEMKGLQGVVYEIVAAENIGTLDGTVYYRAGETVSEIMTDELGKAATAPLYLGKYFVIEKSTVSGMVLDTTQHEVTLTYADQHTAIVTESLALENIRQKADADITKIAEYFDYKTGAFYTDYGAGFVFGLYSKAAIGDIPADALMDILVTDDNGKAVSTADLPLDEYYLKELDVPQAYIDAQEQYGIDLTSKNDTDAAFTDSADAENTLKKGKIVIYKTDAADSKRGLDSVVFEVRKKGEKDVICIITTDENGRGESQLLPHGEYTVKERETKAGFILSDEEHDVTIGDEKSTITLKLTNTANEVILEKVDITNSEALPGATIEVTNEAGEVVFTDVTNNDGNVILHELPAGTYTWKETIAPEGYSINAAEFTFTIDEYGKVTGDTEMTDEPTSITVKKLDAHTGKPMSGVVFTLLDKQGNAIRLTKTEAGYYIPDENGAETFAVNEKGEAEIRYIPVGEYTLVETTPAGYIPSQDSIITLTDEYGISNPCGVVVYNEPTAFKLFKVRDDNGKPLAGAGFTFKTKGILFFDTLKFDKLSDGVYMQNANGTETVLMTDAKGELTVYGLPIGEVWAEESVVPKGFFPIAAFKIEITAGNWSKEPLVMTVRNAVFVKLGLDTDKYEYLYPYIGAALLLSGGLAAFFIIRKKKRTHKTTESEE